MGYETKLIIGHFYPDSGERETVKDKSKPYKDGSGFEDAKDAKGNTVYSGRIAHYFSIYAELNLCKLGYQDDALNKLADKSHQGPKNKAFFFYGIDGNNRVQEDCYGAKMFPVPIKRVLKAMKASVDPQEPYRRLTWAIALLGAMQNDSEDLQCLFYGY